MPPDSTRRTSQSHGNFTSSSRDTSRDEYWMGVPGSVHYRRPRITRQTAPVPRLRTSASFFFRDNSTRYQPLRTISIFCNDEPPRGIVIPPVEKMRGKTFTRIFFFRLLFPPFLTSVSPTSLSDKIIPWRRLRKNGHRQPRSLAPRSMSTGSQLVAVYLPARTPGP